MSIELRKFAQGRAKTVCVSSILVALGVNIKKFKYTWNGYRNTWDYTLRRNGWSVRSRRSWLPKKCTVSEAGKHIRKLQESGKDHHRTVYAIGVQNHLLLLDNHGLVLVDTDPRERDRRQVVNIHAITAKYNRT